MSKRVVVVNAEDGKSGINPGYDQPRAYSFQHTPGFETSVLWGTTPGSKLPTKGEDAALTTISTHPDPGGTVFMMLTLPPDSVYFSPEYDPVLAGQEFAEHAVGIAERMEPDAPGFHRTQTVDYVWVAKGQVVLETDTGEVTLEENDVVVQNGTRHAWRNRTDSPATLGVVLVGVDA